ncbi:MAG: hypothetical protein GY828_02905 [Candidatus Gracilibacteria bacterium]|nr:hypothetical protein [Candidatus Gracilibacteria bacterium]
MKIFIAILTTVILTSTAVKAEDIAAGLYELKNENDSLHIAGVKIIYSSSNECEDFIKKSHVKVTQESYGCLVDDYLITKMDDGTHFSFIISGPNTSP